LTSTDQLEQPKLWEPPHEVLEFAAGHQQQPASASRHARHGLLVELSVMSNGPS
jgi:hypothetical protein